MKIATKIYGKYQPADKQGYISKEREGKMGVELITREDLEQFKKELFEELRQGGQRPSIENQKWLKSYQVKNLLKISPGTLQNLRVNGTLRFTKIGGILYYKQEDILQVLEGKPKEESQSIRKSIK